MGAGWWGYLASSARVMMMAATGSVVLAVAVVTGTAIVEYSKIETRLQAYSENEMASLHALVVSVMEQRLTDSNDAAIGVFNQLILRRNSVYPGKVWTVWSPQVARFVARTAPQKPAKLPQDEIDVAALRSGRPQGRFVDGAYRYSLPIVLGVTLGAEQEACHVCHQRKMDLQDGQVIAVFSSRLSTTQEFAALRRLLTEMAVASLLGALAVALASGLIAANRKRGQHEFDTQIGRFKTVLDNMLQGVLLCTNDGKVLTVNRRFCEINGLPVDSVVPGMSYAEMTQILVSSGKMGPKELNEIRRCRNELVQRGQAASLVWKLEDGRSFIVTHQPLEDGWLTTYYDATEQHAAQEKIEYLAMHDSLTNLANRVSLQNHLNHATSQTRSGKGFALHLLDLDRFKAVNDNLGHPIGDRLLQAVAERLRKEVRGTDFAARVGGDEFVIIQAPIKSPNDAFVLAQRLIDRIKAPYDIDGNRISIGVSIGIAFAPHDGQDAEHLTKCADAALYQAKAAGRSAYRRFLVPNNVPLAQCSPESASLSSV